MMQPDLMPVGYIGKTRGLKGELKFVLEQDVLLPADVPVLYVQDGAALVPYSVANLSFQENGGFILFQGINSSEQARPIVGKALFALRQSLPEPEFTYKELISYAVKDLRAGELGFLTGVEHFPQQWIGRIDHDGAEILVPLNEHTVVEINDKEKKLYLDLPEGLVEIYLAP